MSKPLTHHVVARAREIIANPDRWTFGQYAAFKNGKVAEPYYQRAYRFCAVGALNRAAYELTGEHSFKTDTLAENAHRAVLEAAGVKGKGLERINDGPNGHAQVLELFDRFLKTY
jgi:hypothetical protein